MLDLSLFRIGSFAGANLVAMLVSLGMFGVFFFVSLYIQNILGYSPTQAGASFLPMTVLIILVAPIAGKISDRIGSRWLMGGGMTLVGISLLLYQRVGLHSTFWTLLPAMLLGGVGMAMTMSPMTAAAMGSVPVDKAGVGSGVLNSFRQLGGSLGIALMGAILASYVTAPPRSPPGAQQFVNGLHAALLVSAGITFAAAVVAIVARADEARGRARARRGDRPHERDSSAHGGRRPPRGTSSRPRSASSRKAATAARRPPRSPAPRASPSRSSTATSPSKRDLYLAALEHVWAKTREAWERALDETPRRVRRDRGDRQGTRLGPRSRSSSSRSCGCRR